MKGWEINLDTDQVLERVKYRKTRLRKRPRRESTLSEYRYIYERFNQFPPPNRESLEKVERFLRKAGSDSTKRHVYYALKSAFKSLGLEWFTEEHDPLPPPTEDSKVERPWYRVEEMEAMMNAAGQNPLTLRDYLIIRMAYLSGARRIQIAKLEKKNYDKRAGTLRIPPAKDTPAGDWIVDPTTKPLLEKYIRSLSDSTPYLFPHQAGKGMIGVGSITYVFKKYAKLASVEYREKGMKHGKGAHGARRGRATYLHQVLHMDDTDINKALRWSPSSKMSSIYNRELPSDVDQRVAKEDPFYHEGENPEEDENV